jgi:RNA 3'-terminal phosphate cyclase
MTEDNSTCPIRVKLILSLLSGKTLKLKNIRKDEENPGLTGKQKFNNFIKIILIYKQTLFN